MSEAFSQNLKELRKNMGLSQQELAEHLNVHIGSITKWEKGGVRPRSQKIAEIAEFFGISPDELRGTKLASDGTRKRLSKSELKKYKTIGQKLKALRLHFDLNYTELGRAINATSYTVSKWEKELSKPYSDKMEKLAEFFGVEYEELAGRPKLENSIGLQIKALRGEAGLSREVLSKKIGMSMQSIHSWEQGKTFPRPAALNKLAEIFNISVDDLKIEDGELDNFEEMDEVEVMDTIPAFTHEDFIAVDMLEDDLSTDDEDDAVELEEDLPALLTVIEPLPPIIPAWENEIIDLEVLFASENKRLVIGNSLLTQEERDRALNVLKAVFHNTKG